MTEQNTSDDRDESAIPELLDRIDELLLADDDDDDMPEADLDRAYTLLLGRLGRTPGSDLRVDATDDLEWEHFVLIATATFESTLARDPSIADRTIREVRLLDREITSAIDSRHPVTGRLIAPVLRLERGQFGTKAGLIGVPVTSEPLRIRISIDGVVIDVVAVNGEYSGATTASVDAKAFSTARVSVSVLR